MSEHGGCNRNLSRNDLDATNNCCFNNNSNNTNNNHNNHNYIDDHDEELSLKFELSTTRNTNPKSEEDSETVENKNDHENDHNDVQKSEEEKESSNELHLSYCRGLSRTPLAVPMVADISQNSVTRNDAKAITETRLKRLKELSGRPEEQLSKDQKDEKKRIIRLEKNRRAAAMSRRKKKMYVKGLEEKYNLMARHLAILEMENAHLRAILNTSHHNQHSNITNITNIPHFKIPNISHFQIPHLPNIPNIMSNNSISETVNNSVNNSCSNNTNSATTNTTNTTTSINSIEPIDENHNNDNDSPQPALKRRKLNDGSCLNTITPSLSCDNSSDISILEPLPISQNIVAPPSTLPQFNIHHHLLPPNITNVPSRLISYPHQSHQILPQFNIPHNLLNTNNQNQNQNKVVEGICIENDEKNDIQTESKSIEIEERNNNSNDDNNDMPPEIVVPRLSNEFFSIDDDIINETVDQCGSVIAFQQEIKQNNVYL